MRKTLLLLMAGAMLAVIVGCSGEPTTPVSNVPTVPGSPTTSPATVVPGTPLPTIPGQAVCRVAAPIGNPVADLPPVTDQDWVRGNPDAPLTLIEYADFQ